MSYNNKELVPTPATASVKLHQEVVENLVAHYEQILTPELLIAHRKGCYGTVINTTYNGIKLERLLGTNNAKVATEQVLVSMTSKICSVTS